MSKALKYTGIAITGGLIGAALGLLYAPASGAETRRRVARRLEEEREALARHGRDLSESVRESRRRLAAVVNG